MGAWSDLKGGSVSDGRATVDTAIVMLNERVKLHPPTKEYLTAYVKFVADWVSAKKAKLTTPIVKVFVERTTTWINQLPAQGVDTSGIPLPKLTEDSSEFSWWDFALKAAIVGGAMYGGYSLLFGGRKAAEVTHGDEPE